MKRVIICIVIALVMITLSIWGLVYVGNVCESGRSSIARIQEAYDRGDNEEVKSAAEKLFSDWDKFCQMHIFITDSEHVLEISNIIERIRQMSMEPEPEEDIKTECAAASRLMELYYDEQVPNLMNIL